MSWAVATCRTRLEVPLADRIGEGGYRAYTPRISSPRGDRGAFPGYLFVATETLLSSASIAARWGAGFRVLLSGGEFSEVSEDLVESIRRDEAAGMFDEVFHIRNGSFLMGQWLKVETGPMAGTAGFVTRAKRHHTWIDNPEDEYFRHGAIRFPNSILQALEKTV